MAPKRILVRGSLNVDGASLTFTGRSYTRRGGKGANVSAACACGGAEVDICGAAGRDGDVVVNALRSAGVGTSLLHIDPTTPTGRAIIQVERDGGENSIIILAGCNAIPLHLPALDDYALLICQNEIPLEETAKALRAARQAGLVTLFNPSPVPTPDKLRTFPLECVDWLVVNEDEAAALAKALGVEALESAAELGSCAGVVVTRGRRGAYVLLPHRTGERRVEVEAPKVEHVVDTTGAGDAFTGFLAAQLVRASDPRAPSVDEIRTALTLAVQAASISVTHSGAIASYPSLSDVEQAVSRK